MSTVRVPANVDTDDKVLYGLTVRQVALLVPVGIGLLAAWHALDTVVPITALAIGCAVVAAIAVALVLGKRDGTSLDRMAWAAIRHPRTILAPGMANAVVPVSVGKPSRRETVFALLGPIRAITSEGLDLGGRGVAVGVDAAGVNFGLRSADEQSMLVASFARLTHALPGGWQVVVSTRPATMDSHVAHVRNAARRLPQRRLRQAAADSVSWLDELADTTVLLEREITIVVTAAGFTEAQR